jgi:hypothetical protein
MTVREDLLNEAKQYVSKDRNSTYDEPENNFGRIAAIMNVMGYRKGMAEIQGHDVALIMMAVKMARLAHTPDHKDSWVDTAGYAACGYDCLLAEQQKTTPPIYTAGGGATVTTVNNSSSVKVTPVDYDHARPRFSPILRGNDDL